MHERPSCLAPWPSLCLVRGKRLREGQGPQREAPQLDHSRRGGTRRLVAHKRGRASLGLSQPSRQTSFADRKLNDNGNPAFWHAAPRLPGPASSGSETSPEALL